MPKHIRKHVHYLQSSVSEPANRSNEVRPHRSLSPELIALRAYELWRQRGSPVGSPEIDWLEAERELKEQTAAPFLG